MAYVPEGVETSPQTIAVTLAASLPVGLRFAVAIRPMRGFLTLTDGTSDRDVVATLITPAPLMFA